MTRTEQLTDLADSIRALTQSRQEATILEQSITQTITTRSGKTHAKRTRERRRHTVTHQSLLDELAQAAIPGANGTAATPAGFESRPAAELDPISVLREITDDASWWARALNLDEPNLPKLLSALVSAHTDDAQLAYLTRQADRWVHRALVATGHEPPPVTLKDPCPYCGRHNSLTITGDLNAAKCGRCGTRWNINTIGLLADMIRANQEHETMTDHTIRCWMPDCTARGIHDTHQDGRGRSWGDTCDLPATPGLTAV